MPQVVKILKGSGQIDDHVLMFELGLNRRLVLAPVFLVGCFVVATLLWASPESTEIIVSGESPAALAFDDVGKPDPRATSTGSLIPPDAVAGETAPGATDPGSSVTAPNFGSAKTASAVSDSTILLQPPSSSAQEGETPPSPIVTTVPGSTTTLGETNITSAQRSTRPTTAPTTTQPSTSTTGATTASTTVTTPPNTTAVPTTVPPTTATSNRPPTTAPPATTGEPVIGVMLEGESTSDPNDGWNQYPSLVTNQLGSAITVRVDGTNGYRIDDVNNEGSKVHLLTSGSGANVAVLWIGINDTSQGREPSRTYSEITAWVQNRHAEGWDHVVILTVTKFEHGESVKSYSWGSHGVADQKRQELNQLIVGNTAQADRVVDLRNVIGIGDSYSVHDTTYRADRVHFTDTGNELVAEAVVSAIRSLQP